MYLLNLLFLRPGVDYPHLTKFLTSFLGECFYLGKLAISGRTSQPADTTENLATQEQPDTRDSRGTAAKGEAATVHFKFSGALVLSSHM